MSFMLKKKISEDSDDYHEDDISDSDDEGRMGFGCFRCAKKKKKKGNNNDADGYHEDDLSDSEEERKSNPSCFCCCCFGGGKKTKRTRKGKSNVARPVKQQQQRQQQQRNEAKQTEEIEESSSEEESEEKKEEESEEDTEKDQIQVVPSTTTKTKVEVEKLPKGPERRYGEDGELYTKEEFYSEYNRDDEWNEALPEDPAFEAEKAQLDELWESGILSEEEYLEAIQYAGLTKNENTKGSTESAETAKQKAQLKELKSLNIITEAEYIEAVGLLEEEDNIRKSIEEEGGQVQVQLDAQEEEITEEEKARYEDAKSKEIEHLKELRESGTISASEYEEAVSYVGAAGTHSENPERAKQIAHLDELLESGILTQDEYDEAVLYAGHKKTVEKEDHSDVTEMDKQIAQLEELKAMKIISESEYEEAIEYFMDGAKSSVRKRQINHLDELLASGVVTQEEYDDLIQFAGKENRSKKENPERVKQIAHLDKLLESGILTQDEYDEAVLYAGHMKISHQKTQGSNDEIDVENAESDERENQIAQLDELRALHVISEEEFEEAVEFVVTGQKRESKVSAKTLEQITGLELLLDNGSLSQEDFDSTVKVLKDHDIAMYKAKKAKARKKKQLQGLQALAEAYDDQQQQQEEEEGEEEQQNGEGGRFDNKMKVEKRYDGEYLFTKEEFYENYGGYEEWDNAFHEDHIWEYEEVDDDKNMVYMEKRYDADGQSYTKEEFHEHYGGYEEWNQALPEKVEKRETKKRVKKTMVNKSGKSPIKSKAKKEKDVKASLPLPPPPPPKPLTYSQMRAAHNISDTEVVVKTVTIKQLNLDHEKKKEELLKKIEIKKAAALEEERLKVELLKQKRAEAAATRLDKKAKEARLNSKVPPGVPKVKPFVAKKIVVPEPPPPPKKIVYTNYIGDAPVKSVPFEKPAWKHSELEKKRERVAARKKRLKQNYKREISGNGSRSRHFEKYEENIDTEEGDEEDREVEAYDRRWQQEHGEEEEETQDLPVESTDGKEEDSYNIPEEDSILLSDKERLRREQEEDAAIAAKFEAAEQSSIDFADISAIKGISDEDGQPKTPSSENKESAGKEELGWWAKQKARRAARLEEQNKAKTESSKSAPVPVSTSKDIENKEGNDGEELGWWGRQKAKRAARLEEQRKAEMSKPKVEPKVELKATGPSSGGTSL